MTQTAHHTTKTDIAKTYDVTKQTALRWVQSEGFPARNQYGWDREAVAAWVDALAERKAERAEAAGDKDEKTRLECERLRVVIKRLNEEAKQARLETQRQERKLHNVEECEREWVRAGQVLSSAAESFRQHETAKRPELKDLIDGLCDMFLQHVRAMR